MFCKRYNVANITCRLNKCVISIFAIFRFDKCRRREETVKILYKLSTIFYSIGKSFFFVKQKLKSITQRFISISWSNVNATLRTRTAIRRNKRIRSKIGCIDMFTLTFIIITHTYLFLSLALAPHFLHCTDCDYILRVSSLGLISLICSARRTRASIL